MTLEVKGEKSMWHSSLRKSLLSLQPANCFHAGVHSNILVCLGRNPTQFPANAFLSFNIQGELSVHKSRRLPGLLAEAIHHHPWGIQPPGSRSWQSCQVCGRGRGETMQPHARLLLGKLVLYICKVCGRSVVMQGPGKSHRRMVAHSSVSTQMINGKTPPALPELLSPHP